MRAEACAKPHLEFLAEILEDEVAVRQEHRMERRMAAAKFPQPKLLSSFGASHFPGGLRMKIEALKTLRFIENGENAIFVGNPGTGKTHLAIGLGIEACSRGMEALSTNVPNLAVELREPLSASQARSLKRRFERCGLAYWTSWGT
jgi:DNA replication protein DnaC